MPALAGMLHICKESEDEAAAAGPLQGSSGAGLWTEVFHSVGHHACRAQGNPMAARG
jgi:hypothetical protein